MSFAWGYLGFTSVNRVTSATVGADDAHVGVGSVITPGRTSTAAVIHLVRFGRGRLAPWEVVGTDDTDFSLTSPLYGSAASSPLTVGGLITGVEDAIHVQVRELDAAGPLADSCCHGAVSGQGQPWSATIASLPGGPDRVLTVVAWHDNGLSPVGRFAVTGLLAPVLTTTSYRGPHFATPQAAMARLAAAYNAGNVAGLHAVTNPPAYANLCTLRHRYPPAMHKPGFGHMQFIAAPALNSGWYMYLVLSCG